ncbi:MAG: recombinase family protein [Ruminiclostridium sp.]|nr:recombinase family protein [Ruminiclostridium sp.]
MLAPTIPTKTDGVTRVTVIPAKPQTETAKKKSSVKRVAAYCRVSTAEDEQLNSYETQCQYYDEYIASHEDWKKVAIFADEGITGTQAKKRPEFLRMIRYCRRGSIDIILAKSVSRFARNTVESLQYVRELKELGIAVIFEKENINTLEQSDEMLLTIFSWFAQAESESISKNVSWGIRRSFEQGKFSMATVFGYEKDENGDPRIVPEQAETVRMIFDMFLTGSSYRNIIDRLKGLGRPKRNGKTDWSVANISKILQNEKYAGDALLQKTYTTDCISKKKKKNTGELPMYYVTDHHEAIIDRDTFNKAQVEISRRNCLNKASQNPTNNSGKYSAKYALTERMYCAECGAAYRRTTWTAKGYKEIVWRCVSRLESGKKKCHHSPTLHEESVHRAILDAINSFCAIGDDVRQKLRADIQEVVIPNGQIISQLEQLRSDRNDEISRLLELSLTETDYTKYDGEFKRLSDEIDAINEQIRTERDKLTDHSITTDAVQNILDEIDRTEFRLTEYDDTLTRRFIERIDVIDKHTIRITFIGGFQTEKVLE